MRTASSAALRALPTPTVATGMPFGICTIDRSESSPSSCCERHGHADHRQGGERRGHAREVGGAAGTGDDHAQATRRRRSARTRTSTSGVRCAETTWTSRGTPNSSRMSSASCMTRQIGVAPHDHADERRRSARVDARPASRGALLARSFSYMSLTSSSKRHAREPPEGLARLRRVAPEQVDLGRSLEAGVLVHERLPVVVAGVAERDVEELAHRVRLAGCDHVVVGLVLLEHQPHRLDVVAGVARSRAPSRGCRG